MNDITARICAIDDTLASIREFRKVAFQPMPPPQGAAAPAPPPPGGDPNAAPQGAPPPGADPNAGGGAAPPPAQGDPSMGGAPPPPGGDPSGGGGAPPPGGSGSVPPELEQAMSDTMTAVEQISGTVQQHQQQMMSMKQELQDSREQLIEMRTKMEMLEKSVSQSTEAYSPQQDPSQAGQMPQAGGGGGMPVDPSLTMGAGVPSAGEPGMM